MLLIPKAVNWPRPAYLGDGRSALVLAIRMESHPEDYWLQRIALQTMLNFQKGTSKPRRLLRVHIHKRREMAVLEAGAAAVQRDVGIDAAGLAVL